MQASQIKVGQQYALSTTPRKGIDDLYSVPARRVRVRAMHQHRFNPTGGEGQEGTWKYDGIRCDEWSNSGTWVTTEITYKSRDFLMPWNEYEAEITKRKQIADIRAKEMAEKIAIHNERLDALRAEMAGYDLRHTTERTYLGGVDKDNHSFDFHIPSNGSVVSMSIEAAERLMAGVAERIYEGIRDAG